MNETHGSKTAPPESGNWGCDVCRTARAVRRRVLAHTLANNGGYLSQACSAAEILATLYLRVMHLGPSEGPLIPRPFAGVPGPHNPHRRHTRCPR